MKILPNPHSDGRMTRSVLFEAAPGQTYAIDAERLYNEPHLLDALARRSRLKIRALDVVAYTILVLGVIGSFLGVWWLWAPGVALCAATLHVNRKSAGDMARIAAERSSEAFLYLHTIGALWLVRA